MVAQKSKKVLIVEDESLVSRMIEGCLQQCGHKVIGRAREGMEALEMTTRLRPDVVLMDIKLPEMDGIEATRRIQQNCPTPIVVLTAYDTPDLVDEVNRAGAGYYLVKPPNTGELQRAITITTTRFEDMMAMRRLNLNLQMEIHERKRAERALRILNSELEQRVDERTHNLRLEVAERLNVEKDILKISEDERSRIAVELHDDLGQHLIAIKFRMALLQQDLEKVDYRFEKEMAMLLTMTENAVSKVRALSRGLYSTNLEHGGLRNSLNQLLSDLRQRFGIQTFLYWQGEEAIMPMDVTTHLFRIAQEAANNAIRHGKADRINIEVENGDSELRFAISDNGSGIKDENRKGTGLGMKIMKYRCDLIDGVFSIKRLAQGGTCVQCRMSSTSPVLKVK